MSYIQTRRFSRARSKKSQEPAVDVDTPDISQEKSVSPDLSSLSETTSERGTLRSRTGLIERVSLFLLNIPARGKVNDSEPGVESPARHRSDSLCTSRSLSSDIRRPSGLGRRASLAASEDSPSSWIQPNEPPPRKETLRSRVLSTPNPPSAYSYPRVARQVKVLASTTATLVHARQQLQIARTTEVIRIILPYLSLTDLCALAPVSKALYSIVKNELYLSIDTETVLCPPKLILVLACKRNLARLVRSFTYRSTEFPAESSLDLTLSLSSSLRSKKKSLSFPTPPALPVRLALSNLCNLSYLTIHFHSSILHHELPFKLKQLIILNEHLSVNEQVALMSWLTTQPTILSLSFPNWRDNAPVPSPSPTSSNCPSSKDGNVGSPLALAFSLPSAPQSSALLPSLLSLRASPDLMILLAPGRRATLVRGIVDIHTTLYAGLRPARLMEALQGVQYLSLRFGEEVDKRTIEKVLNAVAVTLGGNEVDDEGEIVNDQDQSLQSLEVTLERGNSTLQEDQALYKTLSAMLPSVHFLRTLRLYQVPPASSTSHSPRSPAYPTLSSSVPYDLLSTATVASSNGLISGVPEPVATWCRRCPSLQEVRLLSGTEWRMPLHLRPRLSYLNNDNLDVNM